MVANRCSFEQLVGKLEASLESTTLLLPKSGLVVDVEPLSQSRGEKVAELHAADQVTFLRCDPGHLWPPTGYS